MPTEIERKFLITDTVFKDLAVPVYYQQGYLSNNEKGVVRIRIAGDQAFITIKEAVSGISRMEFEYEIPLNDAREMLEKLCVQPTISKYRYKIPFKGLIWEVDEFYGENEGLVIAEVELNSEDQEFEKPSWVGKEVSGVSKFYNVNLISNPFKKWQDT